LEQRNLAAQKHPEGAKKMKSEKSPYLDSGRLADIITAIQTMGVFPWASTQNWETKLPTPSNNDNWLKVFSEHPEFFYLENDWQVLRLRYTYNQTYDPKERRDLKPEEVKDLDPEAKRRLTHKPLDSDQVSMLIRIAIELHSRAIAQEQEKRWWKPALITAGASLVGVIIGACIS